MPQRADADSRKDRVETHAGGWGMLLKGDILMSRGEAYNVRKSSGKTTSGVPLRLDTLIADAGLRLEPGEYTFDCCVCLGRDSSSRIRACKTSMSCSSISERVKPSSKTYSQSSSCPAIEHLPQTGRSPSHFWSHGKRKSGNETEDYSPLSDVYTLHKLYPDFRSRTDLGREFAIETKKKRPLGAFPSKN